MTTMIKLRCTKSFSCLRERQRRPARSTTTGSRVLESYIYALLTPSGLSNMDTRVLRGMEKKN